MPRTITSDKWEGPRFFKLINCYIYNYFISFEPHMRPSIRLSFCPNSFKYPKVSLS